MKSVLSNTVRYIDFIRLREANTTGIVRKHSSIPVPRVLSWSSTDSNAVGAEYILMENAAGVPLFQVWGSMTEFDQLQLIRKLAKLEAQFSAMRFPAYGGLYLGSDIEQPNQPLDELDPSFCIGPSCDRRYNPDPSLDFDKGPCEYPGYFDSSKVIC